jgi:hypothetical protein
MKVKSLPTSFVVRSLLTNVIIPFLGMSFLHIVMAKDYNNSYYEGPHLTDSIDFIKKRITKKRK